MVSGWPFHRIRPLRVAPHGCGPGCDPSAWRCRKDHCDDFPGADSPRRQANRQSLLDAGRKMACLRWRDITQRLARHLVDRSRWLGAAAPHRSSGRARRESGRVARRTAPRVSAGKHGGSRCDLSRAADVRSRSDRHPAPAYRRRPRCHRSRLDPGRARSRVLVQRASRPVTYGEDLRGLAIESNS